MFGGSMSKFKGHEIYNQDGCWYFVDTNEPALTTWRMRPCGHCNMEYTPDGHDGCIGHLPGVINACCGHGKSAKAYIQFTDGSIIRGPSALERMQEMMTFEVWVEGYQITGGSGTHRLMGKAEGVNFKAACVSLFKGDKYFNERAITHWARRLYSNASDAAEAFG
jgi:hypothetical protein